MQQLQGTFPNTVPSGIAGLNVALLDFHNAGWTTGRQSIQPLDAKPTIARPWTIYGFGMQGKGFISPQSGPGNQPFGRLGKLYGGVLTGSSFVAQNSTPFALPPSPSLPNITTLWDGTTDPPFPIATGTNNDLTSGYFSATFQLPQPLVLGPSDQIAVGIWLTPALLNEVSTEIYNVSWTIAYDNYAR